MRSHIEQTGKKKVRNYRNASAVVNRLVECGMLTDCIVRDHQHETPRVSFTITEKSKAALHMFD